MINPLNAELNPICHLLALLESHHILHVSRVRVKYCGVSFSSHPVDGSANCYLLPNSVVVLRAYVQCVVVRSVQTQWHMLEVCVYSFILGSLWEICKVQILCPVPQDIRYLFILVRHPIMELCFRILNME